MSVYTAYKPLRNFLRQCNIDASLADVWQFALHIRADGPAPCELGMPPYDVRGYAYPWDLPVIAREVILHADPGGSRRLRSRDAWARIINGIRAVGAAAAKERLELDDVMSELHRVGHLQFPWQQGSTEASLVRYLKVFGAPELERILVQKTGFSVRHYFFLGMWLAGHLRSRFDINARQDFTAFGIPQEQSYRFFLGLSKPVQQLRELILASQKYDASWEYVWNPLEATPLVSLDAANPHHLHCPVPDLLMRRFSMGMYYDLVKAPNFNIAFGPAFQNYIGEVLRKVFDGTQVLIHAEEEYQVGKQLHHGADWILEDPTANLFLECKTKRMVQRAKVSVGGPDLEEEIGVLAGAVVQLYKNVLEAHAGKSNWRTNGLPSYALVVTMEDWFMFGPLPQTMLANAVHKGMSDAGLDCQLLDRVPYGIASARELEGFANIIRAVGIQRFFRGKATEEYRAWMWTDYARKNFPEQRLQNAFALFPEAWPRVLPLEALRNVPGASAAA